VVCPIPFSPMWVMRFPRTCISGKHASYVSVEPPTMIESVPLAAPSEPPETGASTQAAPTSAARAANRCVDRRAGGLYRLQHDTDRGVDPTELEGCKRRKIDPGYASWVQRSERGSCGLFDQADIIGFEPAESGHRSAF